MEDSGKPQPLLTIAFPQSQDRSSRFSDDTFVIKEKMPQKTSSITFNG